MSFNFQVTTIDKTRSIDLLSVFPFLWSGKNKIRLFLERFFIPQVPSMPSNKVANDQAVQSLSLGKLNVSF